MKTEEIMNFTEMEKEFAEILSEIGIKKKIAKVLAFLANTPEATSREIERETDLRQPDVSLAMKYLMKQGWITSRENKKDSKGHPIKIYELAKPINEIMDRIEKESKDKANDQLKLVKKLRDYIN
jgi:predicted transcriptional regulator